MNSRKVCEDNPEPGGFKAINQPIKAVDEGGLFWDKWETGLNSMNKKLSTNINSDGDGIKKVGLKEVQENKQQIGVVPPLWPATRGDSRRHRLGLDRNRYGRKLIG